MDNGMLNVALEYALILFEEDIIDVIIEEELSMERKKEVLMSLDDESKRTILIKLGFSKEFLKTL
jgi:hypothetical protein